MALPRVAPTPPVGAFPMGRIVPYITAWSSEQDLPGTLVGRHGRLAYADEHPADRDSIGTLWRRVGISPGKGRPEFGAVHTPRQRRAMQRVLCQVCGNQPDHNDDGVLWLMGRTEYERDPWPAPIESPHPPVCLPCAVTAVTLCPHLRDHYTALRVRRFHPSGVFGALHIPGPLRPRIIAAETLALSDSRLRWMQASQLIMRLADYRVVDLDAEAAAHGLIS
ncbi:hypothetical protein [Actinacidiphila sp. ITFR-21]|uniref:hypothetical protein n=1 Tax=Actinacidiphila sp. ITFR-21 TaxID=3075199 RepID=UPI00288BC649|nr:hypothetical protein [Streptomyces sp. ITFR-21]WNI15349.1 hypothetical protein RLT57_07265 [Streptomyces sp. ITFR-21]